MTRDQFEAAFIDAIHEQDRMERPIRPLIDLVWESLERRSLVQPEVEAFKDAIELLECCRGTGDLVCDAYSCFCDREEIHGLKVHERLGLHEVVDAFLKKHSQFAALERSSEEKP